MSDFSGILFTKNQLVNKTFGMSDLQVRNLDNKTDKEMLCLLGEGAA